WRFCRSSRCSGVRISSRFERASASSICDSTDLLSQPRAILRNPTLLRLCPEARGGGDAEGDGLRHLDAVDGGGEDAAGIARSLAGGIEASRVEALEVVLPRDADRRGGPRLDAGQHGVVHGEASDLAVEGGKRLADGRDRVLRQARSQVPQAHPGPVGWQDRAEGRGGAVRQEVAYQLGRRIVGAPAEREGALLPPALEVNAGQGAAGI